MVTAALIDREWEHWGPTPSGLVLGNEEEVDVTRAVAGQCIALGISERCKTIPIFAPGSNINQAAQHDLDAITGQSTGTPKSPLLHYAAEENQATTGWYRNVYPCIQGTYDTAVEECDEYPFASTEESGPGASLRPISKQDNRIEGYYLKHFYLACGVNVPGSSFLTVPIPWDENEASPKFETAEWCG
jgi:hypothetical protein